MFNIKKLINVIITIIIIAAISIAVYRDFDTIKQWPVIKEFFTVKETNTAVVENEKTKYNAARKANDDVLAWLSWGAVSLELPIVGTNDNNFYLLRNAGSRYDGFGAAFLDRANRGELNKVNVVYGRTTKELFGNFNQLFKMDDLSKINMYDGKIVREYTVFCIYKSKDGNEEFNTDISKPGDIDTLIRQLKAKSTHKWNVSGKNELLILCSYKNNLDGIQNVVAAIRTK